MKSNVRRTKTRGSLTDSIRIETKTSSIGLPTLNEKMGTREVYDIKLQKSVPYVSDPDKWYQYLLDLREGNVEPHNQDRYIVDGGWKQGQLKDMEALQKEMHENQRPVVNLVTPVAQATEMAKSEIKRDREMAARKKFVPAGRRQNVYKSITKDYL